MKRIIALLLMLMLLVTSCNLDAKNSSSTHLNEQTPNVEVTTSSPDDSNQTVPPEDDSEENNQPENNQPENNQPENNQPENNQPETTHNYKATVTAPTCESAGYTTYTCSDCGDSYVADNVASLGHDLDSTVTAPTCENAGYTTYVCITCSYTYVSDQVAALGHNWKAATTEAPKTCQTCGETEGDALPGTSGGYSETLYVHYIDVGQGDSIFIKVGDCDILIDAGKSAYGSTVSNYLKSQGVDDIELMINSHPDNDHYGGLPTVLANFKVEKFWGSAYPKTGTEYTSFKNAVANEGLSFITPAAGTVYEYEYLTVAVLYSTKGSDSNNSSLIIMVQYGSFKFLFTGDMGSSQESKVLATGVDLSCDVLKVGHHGSKTSSTAEFLNATGADYGVICVGAGNSYGHPTNDALSRLSSAGIDVYRTDTDGDVVFSTDGAELTLPGNGGTVSGGSSSGSLSGSSSSGSSSGSSSSSTYYIGNKNSKVYHLPTCGNLPSAANRVTLYSTSGYTPCGRCIKNTTYYIANTETKKYHLPTCSYLPDASKQKVIYSTTGYSPCGHCIK